MTAPLRRILAALSACLLAAACIPQQTGDASSPQARPEPGERAQIDRQQAEAHRQLGTGLEEAGEIAGAADEFEAALALGPWPLASSAGGLADSPYGDLARICWRSEPAEQVVRACTRVIRSYRFQSSRLAELYANRAAARLSLGETDRAMNDYKTVLKIDSNNPRGLLVRGRMRAKEGRHATALIDFNRVFANGPDRLDARYARALSLAALGDFEGAIADYDTVLSDPEGIAAYPDAYRDRAEAYCQTGQAGAASVGWQVWLGTRPDGPAYVQEMLMARGFLGGAVADEFTPEALAALRDWTKEGCPGAD